MLDASALLAASLGEPGYERVAAIIPQACISAVNLAEVLARLQGDGVDLAVYLADLGQTGLEVVLFDHEQALSTARLLRARSPTGCLWEIARALPLLSPVPCRRSRPTGRGPELRSASPSS